MDVENTNHNSVEYVDLSKIESMAFTSPLSYRFYMRQERMVDSWKCLYEELLHELFRILSARVEEKKILTVFGENEFGDLKATKGMKKPISVRRGFYVESDLPVDTMLRRIRDLLLLHDFPLDYVSIKYEVDIKRKEEYIQRRQNAPQEKVYILDWDSIISLVGAVPISFRYCSLNTRKVTSWTEMYVAIISLLFEDYPQKIRPGISIGDRRSPDVVRVNKMDQLYRPRNISCDLVVETQGTVNSLVDRLYDFLELCRVDPQRVVIKFRFDDAAKEKEYLWSYSRKSVTQSVNDVENGRARRYRFLLTKHFPNGFRMNSTIDTNRFRELYKKQYREELQCSDSDIVVGLHRVGRLSGDRIHTQRTESQQLLIDDVKSMIESTFSEGASCIYLQQLYKRFEVLLVSQMGIYSYEGLTEIIDDIPGMIYTVRRNFICYGRRKPDPTTEIIATLKRLKRPATSEEIAEKLWYIPGEKIHQVLQAADPIVSLGDGQFYYALSFPLTRTEKTRISSAVDSLLRVQGKMTEMELLGVLVQECPDILDNAKDLTWQGFINCICWLFSDTFVHEGKEITRNNRS